MLGYYTNKVAQQFYCGDCLDESKDAMHKCYKCGREYSDNDRYPQEARAGDAEAPRRPRVNPSVQDIKNLLGLGQSEFTKEETERLGG